MNGKRKKTGDDRRRALELWEAPPGAGEPLICLATSFTFDATFFETECLGRFLQMESHPQETEAVGYLIEREEKLASARVCVLVDRQHATSKESLRWDILPVAVRGAIQHAKVAVLCWADHVRLIIGSGNLTEPGYRKNLEVFGSIDISRTNGGFVEPLLATIDFLEQVLAQALGDKDYGPRLRAKQMLSALRRHVAAWPRHEARNNRVFTVFSGTGRSIFDQLKSLWPSARPPRGAHILSPFFDESDHGPLIAGLVDVLAKRRPREVYFHAAAEERPDGKLQLALPREIVEEAGGHADVGVWTVLAQQDEEIRPLHAKMISLMNNEWELVMMGSSNFTRAGTGTSGKRAGNFEANLAYLVRTGEPEARKLERVWRDISDDAIDLESDKVAWAVRTEADGEQMTLTVLPTAFEEALFDSSGPRRLILILGTGLPDWWEIRDSEGRLILSSYDQREGTRRCEIKWQERAVPFELTVNWRTRAGEGLAASWPVNALDPASLPPPDVLASLSLEELIQVLASTRPLHLAVVQALQQRARRNGKTDVPLDPHQRVNTETFLLRRTKRVALALERLRERLERPVLSRDAFDWRLRGPVGPMALARAFQSESRSPGEAAFFLAELALALTRVRPERTAAGGLAAAVVREAIRGCIEVVEGFMNASGLETPPAIQRYVERAFAEAKR